MDYTDYNYHKMPKMPQDDILTMAFVNMQPLTAVYDTETGFCNGTIFPNLNKPLRARGDMK